MPGKNIRPLMGKPLICYTIETARACAAINQIIVSTDSDEIASVAALCGVQVPFRRPPEMATDSAPKIEAIRHATDYVEKNIGFHPEIIVDLDVGAPLREPEDIIECISVLKNRPELDAAVTVYEAERNPYFNMVEFEGDLIKLVKPAGHFVARQAAPRVYSVSGSVFAFKRKSLMEISHLYEGKWGASIVPRERAVDIDHEVDFRFVEYLMKVKLDKGGQD